jgi:hypothetical protein
LRGIWTSTSSFIADRRIKWIAEVIQRVSERNVHLGVVLTRYADRLAYAALIDAVESPQSSGTVERADDVLHRDSESPAMIRNWFYKIRRSCKTNSGLMPGSHTFCVNGLIAADSRAGGEPQRTRSFCSAAARRAERYSNAIRVWLWTYSIPAGLPSTRAG